MKNHSHRLLWTAVTVILIAALLAAGLMALGLPAGLRVSRLLTEVFSAPELEAEFSLEANGVRAACSLFSDSFGEVPIAGLEISGITLYGSNRRLIFDNGRAYSLEEFGSPDPAAVSVALKMLPLAGVRRETQEDGILYRLEPPREVLAQLVPQLQELQQLQAEFLEQDDRLTEIRLHLTHQDTELEAVLELREPRPHQIPDAVRAGASAEQVPSIRVLEPLARAMLELGHRQTLGAELLVRADCGPIKLSDTMMLYGTDEGLYLQRRGKLEQLENFRMEADVLMGLGYELFRSSTVTQVGGSGSYAMVIPAEQVRTWCIRMVPEIEELPISFEDGSLVIEVVDQTMHIVRLDCSGSMPFLFTTIPVSLGVELTPVDSGSLVLPPELS